MGAGAWTGRIVEMVTILHITSIRQKPISKYVRVCYGRRNLQSRKRVPKELCAKSSQLKNCPTLSLFSALDRPPGCLFLYPVRLAEVSSNKAIKSMSHPAPQYNTSGVNL